MQRCDSRILETETGDRRTQDRALWDVVGYPGQSLERIGAGLQSSIRIVVFSKQPIAKAHVLAQRHVEARIAIGIAMKDDSGRAQVSLCARDNVGLQISDVIAVGSRKAVDPTRPSSSQLLGVL